VAFDWAKTMTEPTTERLHYYCPVLASWHKLSPCEKNQKRAKALQRAGYPAQFLEQCLECRGKQLEVHDEKTAKVVTVEPAPPAPQNNGYRPIVWSWNRDRKSEKTKSTKEEVLKPAIKKSQPAHEVKPETPAALALAAVAPMCKNHPDVPAKIDKLGRSLGLCDNCLSQRGSESGALAQHSGRTGPPFCIPINTAEWAELKKWLVAQSKDAVRTLQQEVMYRLKEAKRQWEQGNGHGA